MSTLYNHPLYNNHPLLTSLLLASLSSTIVIIFTSLKSEPTQSFNHQDASKRQVKKNPIVEK